MNQTVIVLDFGGQYKQLIARRVRECHVYCKVLSYRTDIEKIKQIHPIGIIFTGGPNSVYEPGSPAYPREIYELGIPILGICYGMQLMCHSLGGQIVSADISEYGAAIVHNDVTSTLLSGLPETMPSWMSHTDRVEKMPDGFKVTSYSAACPVAAMENDERKLYGVQFHPEVAHTEQGIQIIHNFLYQVCGCKGDWQMSSFVADTIVKLREKIGDKKVLCGLSGGVDSSVAAVMVHKAVGKQLTCIFVDHGLLRKGEAEEVVRVFGGEFDINLVKVDASERFFSKLAGVTEPEKKRKIIGEEFIRVFEEEAKKIGAVDYLVQGTIYPDIIESGTDEASTIKSHHNVGGLPDYVDFKEIIEPLASLFKDEVRQAGIELGLSEALVWRQPFPGPGLAVRIIGEVTRDKANLLQQADAIFREEIFKANLHRDIHQYFAVLTSMKSVGVMGDGRTYHYTLALRGVTTSDFMTADWAKIPYDVLAKVSNRIVNEVQNINRIVYDITSKPPATIEWE